ncbi:MAG: autophagy protein 17 [Icmadophila ericetorum]|nr:autophagy protein 17 [Icmadophila ericetorum]
MTSSVSSLPPAGSDISEPPLETLVSHLLAAKRSLSSVDHVFRANNLVTLTRRALEFHTVTVARTSFLRNGNFSQLRILDHVQTHTKTITQEIVAEFQAVIEDLDITESKLQRTLEQLKTTIVDAKLRPEEEEERNLADFVDETNVQGLLSSIKESIDAVGDARRGYEHSTTALEQEIFNVRNILSLGLGSIDPPNLAASLNSPVPEILHKMENSAKEMATNLESLVNHFDLCVTAIKHTEGGGAAAQQIVVDLPKGIGMELDLENPDTPPEPMSGDERRSMLEVLEKDANEVEDVVFEIRDRLTEMEVAYEQIGAHTDYLTNDCANVTVAFGMLERLGAQLPNYITQSHLFLLKWDEEKAKIEQRMEDLEEMRSFYEGFLGAYDNLIIEVGRRKLMETKITKVLQDALDKVEKLQAEEMAERHDFKQNQGDFLPADIWPGLLTSPTQYQIRSISQSTAKIPDLSKSVIRGAIQRMQSKMPK